MAGEGLPDNGALVQRPERREGDKRASHIDILGMVQVEGTSIKAYKNSSFF